MSAVLILVVLLNGMGFNQFVQSREESPITQTTITTEKSCPAEKITDDLTQESFINSLTSPCKYDKLSRPNSGGPTVIFVKTDVKQFEIVERKLEIKMDVQYFYDDERLRYNDTSPTRGDVSDSTLLDKIWKPQIILGEDGAITGNETKDAFVVITPFGNVSYSYKISTNIHLMDMARFPFDMQVCQVKFKSWIYNTSNLILKWEEDNPVSIDNLNLIEFNMVENSTKSLTEPFGITIKAVNRSVLIYEIKLSRQIGFYIMDYFLPSIMLVCISWVTFWLQADMAAPRITLGTCSMLTFITLSSGHNKALPRVSYISYSGVWFLGCAFFIFASIAEFAFVNIIWRRKEHVELKEASSKYILKSVIITPKLARKSQSLAGLESLVDKQATNKEVYNHYLNEHEFPTTEHPKNTASEDGLDQQKDSSCTTITIPAPEETEEEPRPAPEETEEEPRRSGMWMTTMTPQEIAIWIDRRSRLVFPLAFLVFNTIYWMLVCLL